MSLTVTFLGTSGAIPSTERNTSALAITREGETLLFDCGEGTQRQIMRFEVGLGFNEVFFTHFHADHYLGIIGLVRTMGILDRKDGITLYGPRGAKQILGDALKLGLEKNKFPVEIVELKPGDGLKRKEYVLATYPTSHRAETIGFALVENPRPGRFDVDKARAMGIPEGPLFGRLQKGETVTLPDGREIASKELVGPARPGRKVLYTGDTRPVAAVREAAKGADLLIHEATFADDEKARADETGHSTARQAAELAKAAGALRLALTHVSVRYAYDVSGLLAEAREVFPETVVAKDGMKIEIPYRE